MNPEEIARRRAESRVLESVLERAGMIVRVQSDVVRGGWVYAIRGTTPEKIESVCSEMSALCGWSSEDTHAIIERLARAAEKPSP